MIINVLSGGNLNAASRQALMQKLARIEPTPTLTPTVCASIPPTVVINHSLITLYSNKPTIAQTMTSKSVLLRNMFNPEEYVLITISYRVCLLQ